MWIGLGVTGHALLLWADRFGEPVFAADVQRAVNWIEPPAIVMGPLLLLASGVGMVLDGPWLFGHTWIVVGLSGYAGALALGAGFQVPVGRQYRAIVEERGPDDAEAIAVGRRLSALMWMELGVLVVVVLAMTTKPMDGGPPAFWTIVAAILAGAFWLTARGYRRAAGPEAPQPAPRA